MKVGSRLYSQVCDGQFMVVKCQGDEEISCGGSPLSEEEATAASSSPTAEFAESTLIGKRYTNAEGTVELLCVKGGEGSLSEGTQPMGLKDAKPLPSSD